MTTTGGYTPSTLSQQPTIRTFQLDGDAISKIPSSVNLFRGDVNLPLDILSLPGRNELDVKVSVMYQSNIHNAVDSWNLESPTDILGLGWNMPYEFIAIDNKTTGSNYDDEYYLIAGGTSMRLYRDGVDAATGSWIFETEDYKPWIIRYDPTDETWQITKENGITSIYGGTTPSNSHIQWGVKWGGHNGNWIDSSTNNDYSTQVQFAQAWNLQEIRNPWGEHITFDYEVDLLRLGATGEEYTRSCRLRQIEALDGRKVVFAYQEKQHDNTIQEYQIPHEDRSGQHAYQDNYETQFLDHIEVQDASGSLLFSINFNYALHNVSLGNNDKDFSKRYLTKITQTNEFGDALPGYTFDYYTDAADTHRGALKAITYPTGGVATFTYSQEILPETSHNTTIDIEGIPRVWFGNDYVVVADYDEYNARLELSIYSWNGQWVRSPDSQIIYGVLDIDSLQVVTEQNLFALSFKTSQDMKTHLFHKGKEQFSQWLHEERTLDLNSSGVQTHLAAGSNFVIACASNTTSVILCVWNPQTKQWEDEYVSIRTGSYALAALGNYFVIGVYTSGRGECDFTLFHQNESTQTWDSTELATEIRIEQDEQSNPYLYWSLSNRSATATYLTNLDAGNDEVTYSVRIYQWNNAFDLSSTESASSNTVKSTAFQYSVTSGSLIGNCEHLWRYDGRNWETDDLYIRGDVVKYAYGSDLAIASTNDSFDVQTYNPYEGRWEQARLSNVSEDDYQPTVSGDFFTVGRSVFYKNGQGEITQVEYLPSRAKPDSIINRAPYYLACETEDGSTNIQFIKNGTISGEILLEDESIYVDNDSQGKSGTLLAGYQAFLTYRGSDFDRANRLTLHYVTNEVIEGNLVDFPVVKVTINDGYQESHTSYDYDTSQVVLSAQGIVTEYPNVTVVPGSDDAAVTPFGKTEYFFHNDGVLHGTLRQKDSYDATGIQTACYTVTYDVVSERSQGGSTILLYGYYIQQKKEEDSLFSAVISDDASSGVSLEVTRVVDYEYNSETGLLTQQTTYNYNSSGTEDVLTTSLAYGWEVYPMLKEQNILTPVVKTTKLTNDIVTAIDVSTWKDWGTGKWGPFKNYQAKNQAADFQDWDNLAEPDSDDWLKVSEVTSRTANGIVNESTDVEGLHSSVILDGQQMLPIVELTNATLQESTYVGFEDYETFDDWSLTSGNIVDFIRKGNAYTGVSSLQLNPGVTFQRELLTISPQTYICSLRIKANSDFNTANGGAELKLQFYIGDTPQGTPITQEILIESTGDWHYWHYLLNADDLIGDTSDVQVAISNHNTAQSLLLDHVCFIPLMSEFKVNVYEDRHKIITSQLSAYGDTFRYLYDSFQRKIADVAGSVGLENVRSVTIPYLSRQDEDYIDFPQATPNSALSIYAASGGMYANFTADGEDQWHDSWQPDGDWTSWQVSQGKLIHNGSTSDNITYLPTETFANYGVRLSVRPLGDLLNPVGIQIGDQLTVTWTPQVGWEMTSAYFSPVQVSDAGAIPQEWTLVAADNAVLFYADGKQIFAQSIQSEVVGTLKLFTSDNIEFSNIVTFVDPRLSATYTDGAGKKRQVQYLEDGNCLVSENHYDCLNRIVVSTKTARFNQEFFGYRTNFIQSFDPVSGILTGEIADTYPADEGYPYIRNVYESSTLGRLVQQGIPGREFAITETNSHVVTHEYGTNAQDLFPEAAYSPGQYLVEKLTDANGTYVYTLNDKQGRTLARKAGPTETGSDAYQTLCYDYDDLGHLVKISLPNQFDPAGTSTQKITVEYNFLGQVTSQTTPNSGTVRYIYDLAGRLRFMQDAAGLTSQTILYKKYDRIGRVIEEGWFLGEWDEATLQLSANTDPNYPTNGNWRKQYVFDGDGITPYVLGRLWKVLNANQGDDVIDVEEVYDYRPLNGLTAIGKTLKLEDSDDQVVRHVYNNLGDLIKIIYPNGCNVPEVLYSYNSLGQMTGVGTDDFPQSFAAYSYNADGSLAESDFQELQQTLTYNSPGWLTSISSKTTTDETPVIEQALSYTSDGYGGAGYFSGNIAQNSISYPSFSHPVGNYDYQYQYDNLGRLQVAHNSIDDSASLGVTSPMTYDLNGNILNTSQGAESKTYSYAPNTDQVVDVNSGSQQYSYNDNGDIITASHRGINQIDYDPLTGLTTEVQLEGEPTMVSFKYDGDNKRVIKSVQNSSKQIVVAKKYIHGLNDYPLLEISDQSVQYIYGLNGLLGLVKDGQIYTLLKDHLGSVRLVIDADGDVIAAFDYLPFGDFLGTPYGDPTIISYGYTGQEFDAELGLYNYRARLYDPTLGRFYTRDPKGQFASPYLYVGNNPINLVDPNGELALLVALLIGVGVGAVVGGGVAGYTGAKAGLKGWDLVGYIAAGAAIGGVAGGLSVVGGAAAFAAGTAAATASGSLVAGGLAGAAVGGITGAGIGASQAAANFGVNEAFGIENSGSLSDAVWKGAVIGGVGGAITGGVAGYGGARAAAQSVLAKKAGYDLGSPFKSLRSFDEALDTFQSYGTLPESLKSHPMRWAKALPTKLKSRSTQASLGASVVKSVPSVVSWLATLNVTGEDSSAMTLATASPMTYSQPDVHSSNLAIMPSTSSQMGLLVVPRP